MVFLGITVITLSLNMPFNMYPLPRYIPFLDKTTLLALKTKRKPCLFRRDPDIKFFRISGTCNTLFNVSSLPEVIFSTILPSLSTLEVAEFPMNTFSPPTSGFIVRVHILVSPDMTSNTSVYPLFFSI
ncbi:hypothetical protein Dimus_037811 [Dionaea muscipula]